MMYQTGSGATATQTRDGNMVMDAGGNVATGRHQCNASDCGGTTGNGGSIKETEQKAPCMGSAAVLPVLTGAHSVRVWF
ncbi:hypothetical protein ACLB1M_35140 [Escherichia coli]